jgi:prevent-host-death family protein
MAFETVAVTDVRRGLRDILAKLTRPLFVTQHGRVKAVIMDIDHYNRLMDELDELDDARLAANPEIRRVMADVRGAYQRGEMIPLESPVEDTAEDTVTAAVSHAV